MNIMRSSSIMLCLVGSAWGCSSDDDSTLETDAAVITAPLDAAVATPVDAAVATSGYTAPSPLNPDVAAVASVDRFQDSFGKLFKRSGPAFNPGEVSKVVPAPNAPIDMENFLVKAIGPNGEKVVYYSLDIVADVPAKAYVILDANGAQVANQLPIIDGVPGDASYNDFVQISEVTVGADYVANSFTGFDDVAAALAANKATVKETTRIVNWAAVPKGTKAPRKFLGKSPEGYRVWSKHQVASVLQFDTDLTVAGGKIPTSPIVVIFKNDMSPAEGFLTDANGMTHNLVATLPGQPGYSSYWDHSVGRASGFDSVVDLQSALANVREKAPVIVNCPVVE